METFMLVAIFSLLAFVLGVWYQLMWPMTFPEKDEL